MILTPTPEAVALARRLYLDGEPAKAIIAKTGLGSTGTLDRCLAGDFPDGSGIKPAPLPRRRAGVRVRHRMGSRAALIARMWRTAERQVEEIEDRLKASGLGLDERESNARTLAVVAKTLRELSAFDQAKKPRDKEAQDQDDDNPVPRNIEDLREALARKLAAFVDGRPSRVPDNAE
jgi:hypothetical protein